MLYLVYTRRSIYIYFCVFLFFYCGIENRKKFEMPKRKLEQNEFLIRNLQKRFCYSIDGKIKNALAELKEIFISYNNNLILDLWFDNFEKNVFENFIEDSYEEIWFLDKTYQWVNQEIIKFKKYLEENKNPLLLELIKDKNEFYYKNSEEENETTDDEIQNEVKTSYVPTLSENELPLDSNIGKENNEDCEEENIEVKIALNDILIEVEKSTDEEQQLLTF